MKDVVNETLSQWNFSNYLLKSTVIRRVGWESQTSFQPARILQFYFYEKIVSIIIDIDKLMNKLFINWEISNVYNIFFSKCYFLSHFISYSL